MSDSSHTQTGVGGNDRLSKGCQHTPERKTSAGQMLGSWVEIQIESVTYTACSFCGQKFGSKSQSSVDAQRAYLEQQRRLACPGCGEEPFTG